VRFGLANGVVPVEQLEAAAAKAAQALAAKPRQAMRHTKELMRGDREHLRDVMRKEGQLFGRMLRSPEAKAAFQAFFAKSKG
jgi:enoyl-CoA hydratase/carnithine racemase